MSSELPSVGVELKLEFSVLRRSRFNGSVKGSDEQAS